MKFCSDCGKENSSEAKFCSKCGSDIKHTSESSTKNYSDNYFKRLFSGRIGVGDYWIGYIVLVLVLILGVGIFSEDNLFTSVLGILFFFFSVSLSIRRLHDLNKSWLYIFVLFIPILNLLIGLEMSFVSGKDKANDYGKSISIKESFSERLKRILCIN